MLLEPLFEPEFSEHSHGFRPRRSCHTALAYLREQVKHPSWFLELDIERCFEAIDHRRLMALLEAKGLRDEAVRSLLWKGLRSAVVDLGSCRRRKEGIPQGSVLSPLLANIFLSQLDDWLEQRARSYRRGLRRRNNPAYTAICRRMRQVAPPERRRLQRLRRRVPSRDPRDPGYRRFWWVRYADDVLIAVAGPRSEVVALREELAAFLATLGLRLSETKTLITSATEGNARFLGHLISAPNLRKPAQYQWVGTATGGGCRRPLKPRTAVNGDIRALMAKLVERGYARRGRRAVPTRCGRLIHHSDAMIVDHFRELARGQGLYYCGATNWPKLRARLDYVLRYSCLLTLASKHRLRTKRKAILRYGPDLLVREQPAAAFRRGRRRRPEEHGFGGSGAVVASFPRRFLWKLPVGFRGGAAGPRLTGLAWLENFSRRVARTRKLFADSCSLCGGRKQLEVHHLRRLSDRPTFQPQPRERRKRGGGPDDYLAAMQRRLGRKQVMLCGPCHRRVHAGKHGGSSPRPGS